MPGLTSSFRTGFSLLPTVCTLGAVVMYSWPCRGTRRHDLICSGKSTEMSNVSLNLLVIRSPDIDRSARFYELLGLSFTKHAHGTGPVHYAGELGSAVFEIYPRT